MQDSELHGAETSRLALAHRRKDVHLINHPASGCNKIEALLALEGRRVSAILIG